MCKIKVAPLASVLFVASLLACFSCKETPPEPPPPPPPVHVPVIHLSVADTGLTDLWLRVRFDDTVQQRSWRLTRDGQPLLTVAQAPLDTVVLDDSLAVKRTYTYRAYRLSGTTLTDSTAPLQATTLDTTSHNFFWQIDTLGDGNSSVLYDVAIISDTLVITCGQVYLRDSLGGYQPPCGVAIWNGRQWQIRRLYAQYPTSHTPLRPEGIFAFSATDIWFAWGDVFHWDGRSENVIIHQVTSILGPGQGITTLWGTSGSNLYGVGRGGAIAHYNGSTWQRIESGTTVDLLDVWGSSDGSSVWACGYKSDGSESILLRYDGNQWQVYGHAPPRGVYQNLFASIWFPRADSACVIGDRGVFRHAQNSPVGFRRVLSGLPYFPYRIRGVDRNDAVFVGDAAMIWHFNGSSWRQFDQLINTGDRLRSVAMGSNQIVAVGYRYYGVQIDALIYRGRR
jgi:hypothetical protein